MANRTRCSLKAYSPGRGIHLPLVDPASAPQAHLRAAARRPSPSHRAVDTTSRGLTRAVNNLAVQALFVAFIDDKAIVDESSARAVVAEVATE